MSNVDAPPTDKSLLKEIRDELHRLSNGLDTLSAVNGISAALAAIDTKLSSVLTKETEIMAALDDLAADVAAEDTVIDSAVVLIQGFAAQLAAAGVDPAKLAALRTEIQAKTQALAAAVAANTVPPTA